MTEHSQGDQKMKLSEFISSLDSRWLDLAELNKIISMTESGQIKAPIQHRDETLRDNLSEVTELLNSVGDPDLSRRMNLLMEKLSLDTMMSTKDGSYLTVLCCYTPIVPLTQLMKSVWEKMNSDEEISRDDRLVGLGYLISVNEHFKFVDSDREPSFGFEYSNVARFRLIQMIKECSGSSELYNLIGFVSTLANKGVVILNGDETPLDRVRQNPGLPLIWIPTQGLVKIK